MELTDERLRHILQSHPEVRVYRNQIGSVVGNPEFIRRSKFDSKAFIMKLHYYYDQEADVLYFSKGKPST